MALAVERGVVHGRKRKPVSEQKTQDFIRQRLPLVVGHERDFDIDEIHHIKKPAAALQCKKLVSLDIDLEQCWPNNVTGLQNFIQPANCDRLGRDRLGVWKQRRTVVVPLQIHGRPDHRLRTYRTAVKRGLRIPMKQALKLYGWPTQWLECVDARARMKCSHEKRKLAPVRADID
jgi:hypothetical protein